jgi:hypothetical protein
MQSKTGPKTDWKQTKETVRKLEEAFAWGAGVGEACFYAKISTDTYYRWVREKPGLSDEFERLRIKPILAARQVLMKGILGEKDKDGNYIIKPNPELALKYLERKRKREFSTRIEQRTERRFSLPMITDEEYENLINEHLRRRGFKI